MNCETCSIEFDLDTRAPLVLQCGHTFCKACISRDMEAQGGVQCFKDRAVDSRQVSQLPRNFALVDALKLDLEAAAASRGLHVSRELWLDERELEIPSDEPEGCASGRVVEGTYQDKPVTVKLLDMGDAPRTAAVLGVIGGCHHTCRYKGVTIQGNRFCLVMERYDRTLAQVIADEGAEGGLPLDKLLHYSIQILTAVKELHHKEVIIVDLKPQNLLFNKSLDELVVTVCGQSRIHTQQDSSPSSTEVASLTSYYKSPELIGASMATDMWSWAATVLHMATGREPLRSEVTIMRTSPAVPAHLPPYLKDLLVKCLAHDPASRPTAAAALEAILQAVLGMEQQTRDIELEKAALQQQQQQLGQQQAALQDNRRQWCVDQQQMLQQQHQLLSKQQQEVLGRISTLAERVHQQVAQENGGDGHYTTPNTHAKVQPDLAKHLLLTGKACLNGGDTANDNCTSATWGLDKELSSWKGLTWDQDGQLEKVSIQETAEEGMLPDCWSGLTHLRELDISWECSGLPTFTLPLSWSAWTKLKKLDIKLSMRSGFTITNGLPREWSALTKLTVLHLTTYDVENYEVGRVPGFLPPEWGALAELKSLEITGFNITGGLPVAWSTLTKLENLDLTCNSLIGELPKEWSTLIGLQCLDLCQNKLSGTLPEAWRNLSKLKHLDTSTNSISGGLPVGWSTLTALTYLNLDHNKLSGALPGGWSALVNLHELRIWSNQLCGHLPAELAHCSKLVRLNVSDNNFDGILPMAWTSLTNLERLDIRHNKLSGVVPVEWRNHPNMKWFYAQGNEFTGCMPVSEYSISIDGYRVEWVDSSNE